MSLSREIVARALPSNTSLTNFTDFRCSHDDLERIVEAAYKQGWNDREGDLILGVERLGARHEGARGGEPVASGESFHERLMRQGAARDYAGALATLRTLYASPADPYGWRPINEYRGDGERVLVTRMPHTGKPPTKIAWQYAHSVTDRRWRTGLNKRLRYQPSHFMPLPPTSEGGGA